jgi:RNA polymerase sigma factor (sigma-70 family)
MTDSEIQKIIKDNPKLTKDDEIALFNKYDQSNPLLAEKLYMSMMPWLITIISKYKSIDVDEGLSECWMAVIDALQKYDPSKNTQFASYATYHIRNRLAKLAKANYKSYGDCQLNANIDECDDIDMIDDYAITDQHICDVTRNDRLQHIINTQLSKAEKRVVELYLEGLSFVDMSKQLGISKQAIYAAWDKAIDKLADYKNDLI